MKWIMIVSRLHFDRVEEWVECLVITLLLSCDSYLFSVYFIVNVCIKTDQPSNRG